MWISSLCDSTAKGKPDIELVDMKSRFRTVDDMIVCLSTKGNDAGYVVSCHRILLDGAFYRREPSIFGGGNENEINSS